MKAIAYLRVSTDAQAGEDRFGLSSQRDAVEAYAKSNGIQIINTFTDEGYSGATLTRPGLQEMLAESAEGSFTVVLVAKMDRVARDLFIQLWIEKELLKHGIELVSVSEPFQGKDPMTTAFRQMVGVFAELEKHRIKERMHAGRVQKAKQGGYAGGGAPMGYRAIRGGKALVIDMDQARTVRKVFELKDSHPEWSLQSVADALNREGWKTVRGKQFRKQQVRLILNRRDFYSGTYQYAGVEAEGRHEAIL